MGWLGGYGAAAPQGPENWEQMLAARVPRYASGGSVHQALDPATGQPVGPATTYSQGQAQGMGQTAFGMNPTSSAMPLFGKGDTFNAVVPTSNMQFQNPYGQMLMQQALGKGPNPWAQQLQNATDANIKQAMALGQSMGGGNNMAAMRGILSNTANAQQQAAGQYAGQLAAQQLGAEQMGANNNLDLQKLLLQQSQGNQAAALNTQNTNAQTAALNAGLQNQQVNQVAQMIAGGVNGGAAAIQQALGGGNGQPGYSDTSTEDGSSASPAAGDSGVTSAMNNSGLGSFDNTTYAHGGLVGALPSHFRFAGGGDVPDWVGGTTGSIPGYDPNPLPLQAQGASLPTPGGMSSSTSPGSSGSSSGAGLTGTLAGLVPGGGALVAGGLQFTKPTYDPNYSSNQAENMKFNTPVGSFHLAHGGPISFLMGGGVPGHAQTMGDAARNDTVPAMLSPGEVVLPRSVTQDPDAPELAKAFVEAIRKKKAAK